MLVTRPEPGASRSAAELSRRGFAPVVLPLTEIRPVIPERPLPAHLDGVVFTSANALRHLGAAAAARMRQLPAFLVGRATKEAASGFQIAHVAPDAESLGRHIAATCPRGARLAHPCGRHRRPELGEALAACGIELVPHVVYEAVETGWRSGDAGTKLGSEPFAFALVYSPRGARLLDELMSRKDAGRLFAGTEVAALSFACAQAFAAAGRTISVARQPDEQALMELIEGARGPAPANRHSM